MCCVYECVCDSCARTQQSAVCVGSEQIHCSLNSLMDIKPHLPVGMGRHCLDFEFLEIISLWSFIYIKFIYIPNTAPLSQSPFPIPFTSEGVGPP